MEKWIGAVVGTMHIHRITTYQLAKKIGWSRPYLSSVLNEIRKPSGAERKIKTALHELIAEKEAC